MSPISQTQLKAGKQPELKLSPTPLPARSWYSPSSLWHRKSTIIAVLSILAIALHLLFRFGFRTAPGTCQIPLLATLVLGGLPLLCDLLR
jgi:hypothetical protein